MVLIVGITVTSCGGNSTTRTKLTAEEIQQMKSDSINRVINEFLAKNPIDIDYVILNDAGDGKLYWVERNSPFISDCDSVAIKRADLSTNEIEVAYNPTDNFIIKDVIKLKNGLGYMLFMIQKNNKERPDYIVKMYDITKDEVIQRGTFLGDRCYNVVYNSGDGDDSYTVECNTDWYLYNKIGPLKRIVSYSRETGFVTNNRVMTIFGDELNIDDYLNKKIVPAGIQDELAREWVKGASNPEIYLLAYFENPINFNERYGTGYHPISGTIESIHDGNGADNFIDYMFGPNGYLVILSREINGNKIGIKCWITDKKDASKLSVGQELVVWGKIKVDKNEQFLLVPNAVCSFIEPFYTSKGDKIAYDAYLRDVMYYSLRNGWIRPEE